MPARELLKAPNLISLARIVMALPIGWLLARPGHESALWALGLMILAGFSDGLDGYVARRTGNITPLGVALDPVADKIFAGILVLLLLVYRDFPIWLAVAVVGRDLVIMIAGLILMRGRKISLPSNLTGKYTFASLAVLLASYVFYFEFGITVFTWTTVVFLLASTIVYARVLMKVRAGEEVPEFEDRPILRHTRTILSSTLAVVTIWQALRHLQTW